MIGRLRGLLDAVEGDHVVVDVAGVGYEVSVNPKTVAALGQPGESITVFTHLHSREDALILYGFSSLADRELFRVLLSAQGVGPRMALAILGVFSADALIGAIAREDVDVLTQVPGVGKRTAQRLVLDLRPRLADLEADVVDRSGSEVRQARQGLSELGFTPGEIRDALAGVDPELAAGEQVRAALKASRR